MSFKIIVSKGANIGDQHFLLFPQCFLHKKRQKLSFELHSFCRMQMSSIWSSKKFCCMVIGEKELSCINIKKNLHSSRVLDITPRVMSTKKATYQLRLNYLNFLYFCKEVLEPIFSAINTRTIRTKRSNIAISMMLQPKCLLNPSLHKICYTCPTWKDLQMTINFLPDDKISDWSKLKAFADDKINVTQILKFKIEG